jgi:hypothetical protein
MFGFSFFWLETLFPKSGTANYVLKYDRLPRDSSGEDASEDRLPLSIRSHRMEFTSLLEDKIAPHLACLTDLLRRAHADPAFSWRGKPRVMCTSTGWSMKFSSLAHVLWFGLGWQNGSSSCKYSSVHNTNSEWTGFTPSCMLGRQFFGDLPSFSKSRKRGFRSTFQMRAWICASLSDMLIGFLIKEWLHGREVCWSNSWQVCRHSRDMSKQCVTSYINACLVGFIISCLFRIRHSRQTAIRWSDLLRAYCMIILDLRGHPILWGSKRKSVRNGFSHRPQKSRPER